jgi:hypothetical protein
MRDEYDDSLYQALRHDFASNLRDIARSIAYAFDRLHERMYGAPWSDQSGTANPTRRSNRLTTL